MLYGAFEITVDGKAVEFIRSKTKELLALLVDRAGGGITRKSAFTEIWEDREYDVKMQKYFDVILRSLRKALRENGISEILEGKGGYLRIRPETAWPEGVQPAGQIISYQQLWDLDAQGEGFHNNAAGDRVVDLSQLFSQAGEKLREQGSEALAQQAEAYAAALGTITDGVYSQEVPAPLSRSRCASRALSCLRTTTPARKARW